MLTQSQIDDLLNASRAADEGPTQLVRRIEAAARLEERERCAKVCEALQVNKSPDYYPGQAFDGACRTCAGEIRKGSQ